jgi:hypothetical protein
MDTYKKYSSLLVFANQAKLKSLMQAVSHLSITVTNNRIIKLCGEQVYFGSVLEAPVHDWADLLLLGLWWWAMDRYGLG